MSLLQSLGYVGVGARDTDEWARFATGLIGMQLGEARGGGQVSFRMDERCQRLFIDPDDSAPPLIVGWEVADGAALKSLAARLDQADVAVTRGAADLAEQRFVRELISFHDPLGNRLEAFCGARSATSPFEPGRPISGFRTGEQGMGHIVFTTADLERDAAFYRDVLGFRVSDYMTEPFAACFFHLNPRHHSLALVRGEKCGVHHLMVETLSLDDVGQAYDLADQQKIGVTLGRHTNDYMTSFYIHSPSGFLVEYGWGGRVIDPAGWRPVELTYGPSLWGHERRWLSEPLREAAKELRIRAAKEGRRAPLQVVDGNFQVTGRPG